MKTNYTCEGSKSMIQELKTKISCWEMQMGSKSLIQELTMHFPATSQIPQFRVIFLILGPRFDGIITLFYICVFVSLFSVNQ